MIEVYRVVVGITDEELGFRRFKRKTFEKFLVEDVSPSVFKVSDVMRKIQS